MGVFPARMGVRAPVVGVFAGTGILGVGTAAVVSPIGELYYQEQGYVVNGGRIGELSQKLYDELTGIQWGKRDDPFGWTYRV